MRTCIPQITRTRYHLLVTHIHGHVQYAGDALLGLYFLIVSISAFMLKVVSCIIDGGEWDVYVTRHSHIEQVSHASYS